MLSKEEQKMVVDLVTGTRTLILQELEKAKVTVKGAADYVTNVDFAVQDHLQKKMAELFPKISMIAEEKENRDLSQDKKYWILDPIDGTTNLIHHYGLSAVSLGLYEEGEMTFGVVYNPFYQELFSASKGEGAYFNGERIHVLDTPELKDAVIAYGSSPYEKERAEELFPIFQRIFTHCGDFRRTGSAALDLCYVASGRQHAFVEQNLKPWDYSAGCLILKEAGGVVSTWTGETLPYLTNSDVFACTRVLEKQLREVLQ